MLFCTFVSEFVIENWGLLRITPVFSYHFRLEIMKDRIRQLMLDQAMSQKSFASELCIAEATLSGIFNGRTRPSNQIVSSIHERFPQVNISWLMFGEGAMYTSDAEVKPVESTENNDGVGDEIAADLFSYPPSSSSVSASNEGSAVTSAQMVQAPASAHHSQAQNAYPQASVVAPQVQVVEKYIDKPRRKITEIRIFFDDGTYETFTP
jgi:transcriptional regulator with XRE-family HTH domain